MSLLIYENSHIMCGMAGPPICPTNVDLLKRLLLMPGAAVPDDARSAAQELHERAPRRLSAQMATMALIREAGSYGRGRAKKAAKTFLEKGYVDKCKHDLVSEQAPGKELFERKVRGLDRVFRAVKRGKR